ncbi:MAG: hypothetical protein ACRDOU_12990 [Streptosporangiaceae bacterium]
MAVIAPLAFPGAASADNSATAESLQYVSTSVAPVSGSDAEYDNQATATQTSNGQTAISVTFKVPLSSASVITANNNANASVNNCQNCNAVAISLQAVIAAKQDLAELTASDVANASGTNCNNCNTLAEAFQIVYAPLSTSQASWMVIADFGRLQNQFNALQNSRLSLAQIQTQSTADVKAMVSELQIATEDSQVTPAFGGYQPTTNLTNQQPVIDLLSAFHH